MSTAEQDRLEIEELQERVEQLQAQLDHATADLPSPQECADLYLWAISNGTRTPPEDDDERKRVGRALVWLVEAAGDQLTQEPIDLDAQLGACPNCGHDRPTNPEADLMRCNHCGARWRGARLGVPA